MEIVYFFSRIRLQNFKITFNNQFKKKKKKKKKN
jgi:hypothetical protein